jgi:hypothetical protein
MKKEESKKTSLFVISFILIVFFLNLINLYAAGVNNARPEFKGDLCGTLIWGSNTNKILNMANCFEDIDGDNLTYRYYCNNTHLKISQDENYLTIFPDNDWSGDDYMYFYANDSLVESRGKIHFAVISGEENSKQNNALQILEMKSYSPLREEIIISESESQNFSVDVVNYDNITWYLDEKLINDKSNSYISSNLGIGNHTIKVLIAKKNETIVKNWKVIVSEVSLVGGIYNNISEDKTTMYYLVIIVIAIFILIILMFFFSGKNSEDNEKIREFENEAMNNYGNAFYNPKINPNSQKGDILKKRIDTQIKDELLRQRERKGGFSQQMYGENILIPKQIERRKLEIQQEWQQIQYKYDRVKQEWQQVLEYEKRGIQIEWLQKRKLEIQQEWQELQKRYEIIQQEWQELLKKEQQSKNEEKKEGYRDYYNLEEDK